MYFNIYNVHVVIVSNKLAVQDQKTAIANGFFAKAVIYIIRSFDWIWHSDLSDGAELYREKM